AERDPVLVVAGQGWPAGVVGIVAAKLVDRYHRPALVVALDGAEGRGSARTIPGFHLYDALKRCSELLVRFGGHAQAAGLTIEERQLGALRTRLCAVAEEGTRPASPAVRVDAEVSLDRLDELLVEELERLQPCGI